MPDDDLCPPDIWWVYCTDDKGRRCVLTVTVEQHHVVLTTAAGTRLRLTPAEARRLGTSLDAAAIDVSGHSG